MSGFFERFQHLRGNCSAVNIHRLSDQNIYIIYVHILPHTCQIISLPSSPPLAKHDRPKEAIAHTDFVLHILVSITKRTFIVEHERATIPPSSIPIRSTGTPPSSSWNECKQVTNCPSTESAIGGDWAPLCALTNANANNSTTYLHGNSCRPVLRSVSRTSLLRLRCPRR